VSYAPWVAGRVIPEGIDAASPLFVGACERHLEALRTVMKGQGIDIDALETLPVDGEPKSSPGENSDG
jgi:hypothetical protein